MAITQIRDIAYTKKAPFNHYNLWLHLNDKKRLILEMFFNGKWTEIGKFGENVLEVENNNSIIELLNTLTNNNIDVTTLTLDGTIEDTTYYAEGTYDSESNTITLLRNGWMYVFSIDPETYEISISNKVNLNDEDLYFIVGDTEEIKTHNVNEFKKVKREPSLVRPSYQARVFRLKYSDGMVLHGIGDVPTETQNMYLEISAYSIRLGMKIFRMYSNGTIIETPDEFVNNIATRYILPYEELNSVHEDFDYHNVNEIIIKGTGPNDTGHKVSYFKDATFSTPEPNSVKHVVYTSVMQRPVNRTEEFEDLKYGFRHLLYNTETHMFELKTRDLGNLAFEDNHQTTGYYPTNNNYMPIEAIWAGIRAIEYTRLMVAAHDAGDTSSELLYKAKAENIINGIRAASNDPIEHPILPISRLDSVEDAVEALTGCFGTPFEIS